MRQKDPPHATPAGQCRVNGKTHLWKMAVPVEKDGVLIQYARCVACEEAELIIAKKIEPDATDILGAIEHARKVA